jgi:hypothetical protein
MSLALGLAELLHILGFPRFLRLQLQQEGSVGGNAEVSPQTQVRAAQIAVLEQALQPRVLIVLRLSLQDLVRVIEIHLSLV